MSAHRILSLWFPCLAAERVLRLDGAIGGRPLAVITEDGPAQIIAALSPEAHGAGLRPGQPLRDALAMCPSLVTRPADPLREAAFLATLRRWAGQFTPWAAEQAPDGLVLDITGCAHLFGGEAAMLETVGNRAGSLGLTVRIGLADTPGAAWALARFGRPAQAPGAARAEAPPDMLPDSLPGGRSGDAIAAEAHATRARAARRNRRTRAGETLLPPLSPPEALASKRDAAHPPLAAAIAAPGRTRAALAPLPVAALRITHATAEALNRLGLRRIEEIAGMPRAALARRFGHDLLRRLDQALGLVPEPVSPARPADRFAVRLPLPEPIGHAEDLCAGLDRMLPRLAARLAAAGRGVRRLRLEALRVDGRIVGVEIGLARPSADPDRMRPLLMERLEAIDPGFGIDALRLDAVATETVHPQQHRGHLDAASANSIRHGEPATTPDTGARLDDLIGRLGARLGIEAVTRPHPADSHIPEKAALTFPAAFSAPAPSPWPTAPASRPLLLFPAEPVQATDQPSLPETFRWRRQTFRRQSATGPERIAPEWWLDDPAWRSGLRDYWRVETSDGRRLWLFYAHGAEIAGGWFCQGIFA